MSATYDTTYSIEKAQLSITFLLPQPSFLVCPPSFLFSLQPCELRRCFPSTSRCEYALLFNAGELLPSSQSSALNTQQIHSDPKLFLQYNKTTVKMGRMHAPGKGISKSAMPYKRTPPSWLKLSAEDVEDHVCKLAKKGLTPSQIGVLLRDSNGVSSVRSVTGQKIVRILKANGLAPDIPEDLYMLIKKAVQVRKHLERNRKDKDSKFRLILIESRIHRLARYYRTTRKLPANWKYESATASTMVA